ncbi:beta-1,3-galactosyltransferase 5-like isoform X2 [Pecten maximus]|uniref:beta-1,3-galactosyltransferase 5-like isoform X2 n=1 Tax=Pecten maximus TaxID=6579 RepID=UPI001458C2A0|nr:beta-1,3-galactosyltransferase 5-like isoform X2 [Pecten maximus]
MTIRFLSNGRRRRACLTLCVCVVFLFLVCCNTYEPLTVSGMMEHTNLLVERKPSKVFINPKVKCRDNSTKNTVIMVLNKASSSLRRETIRQTWGHLEMQRKYNFSIYFVIGNEEGAGLKTTDRDNEDILHVDVDEDYFNITEKVIEALNWATHSCFESSYFFKIDDDVYFDLEFLREIQNDRNFVSDDVIRGDCLPETGPFRWTSKFRVSYDDYPFQVYPPYCGGPGYVMTMRTAHKLYREMVNTAVFKFEDVYVGIAAYKQGITVENVEYFIYAMDRFPQYFFIKCARIVHNLTPELITKFWNDRNKRSKVECSNWGKGVSIIQTLFGVFSS